jgi:dienelactone hydrolase
VFLASRYHALTLSMVLASACGSSQVGPTPFEPGPLPGLTISGDPASADGASWKYQARVSGTSYDLEGILLKPQGAGPFPAVIISHGAAATAGGYGREIARAMVEWGLVCIATNYTHASGVPLGAPGTPADAGASTGNVLRARQLVEILRALGYVDVGRLALYGHSLGAFVTTATAGTYPELFRAASHTAGGIGPSAIPAITPTASQVAGVRAPYQLHHGALDFVVPIYADQLLADAFRTQGVEHELVIYPTADHEAVRVNATVLERVRAWYASHGVL